MRSVSKLAAACLVFAVAACNARSGSSLVPPNAPALHPATSSRLVQPVDRGRRAARMPVSVVVLMRYNHQPELDRFVNELARTPHPHYLTREQFMARYAPTVQQQAHVIQVLRASGFTVTQTFANRTLIDASAPSVTVERLFGTEIHDFAQGRYGTRFANVAPIHVPPMLASFVAGVTVNTIVSRRTFLDIGDDSASARLPDLDIPADLKDNGTNAIGNPGFETGHLSPWSTCNGTGVTQKAVVSKAKAHNGKYSAYAGTFSGKSEPNGITTVCQKVTIPSGATLSFWSWGVSNDHKRSVFQFGGVYSTSGKLLTQLYKANKNDSAWESRSISVASFAGQQVILAFGVVGKSSHHGKTLGQFVDDFFLGAGGAPSPSPSPTHSPGTEPTPAPCVSAAPTPTPNVGPDSGWGPAAVNDGFCMPFNYGYNGTGQTAAIVISNTVNPTDLSTYLQQYGITETGTVTNEAIDGGGAVDNQGEASLDLETIAGLATGANVIVYNIPNLSDQAIEDAYNKVLSDAKASVVNSSFGGCEALDTPFAQATNSIAQQGATLGVTFSASSGDQGAGCPGNSSSSFPFGVSAPSSGPYFVAVGGTQSTAPNDSCFTGATSITSPVVWNDCVGAGGGGISTVFTVPSYQSGIPGVSTAGRNVPDISMPAAEDDVYCSGCGFNYGFSNWTAIWGTSWASPEYVAMQIEINQVCGHPQWGINVMYQALSKSGYPHFIDVTSGNNKNPKGTGSYAAGNGFDHASGIGMPIGAFIANDTCGSSIAATHR